MSNRKILIITYYWPPSGGVGVQRWMNYALQLQKRGWKPIIYTTENPQFEIKDEALLEKVKGLRVVKTKIWEPFSFFHLLTKGKNKGQVQQGLVLEKNTSSWKDKLAVWIRGNLIIPDPRKFWVKPSVKFLKEFIAKEEIKTVITTGPPHSMHLIGLRLKRQLAINWLADFRDPWSKWDVLDKLKVGNLARKGHVTLERQVLQHADRVLTVSAHLAESLAELGANERVRLQCNGVSLKPAEPKAISDKLAIGYYGMLNEMRNPSELWKVLDELGNTRKVSLRLGGIVSETIQQEINSLPNLSKSTDFLGYLSHQSLPEEYAKCDVLLLLLNRTDNAKWIIPVKFFEYLAASRQILALGLKDSDLANLAKDVASFQMCSFENVEEIKAFIEAIRGNVDFNQASDLLKQFSHATLAEDLEKVIQEVHGQD